MQSKQPSEDKMKKAVKSYYGLKIDDNAYDCVMCVGVFTHDHVSSAGFNELCRIAKPGGYLCFTINEGVFQKYGFDKLP